MITKVVPVFFQNRDGITLFGTLYKPETAKNSNVLILVNPGLKGRVGPQRLYIKIAKLFAEQGFSVLRFDVAGLGDSEGAIEEVLTRDYFLSVEKGRLVNDIEDAIEWLSKKYGYTTYVLGGLCGGAISSLLTAFTENRVKAVLGLGMPVALEGTEADNLKVLSSWYIRFYKERMLHKSFWKIKLLDKKIYQMVFVMITNLTTTFLKKTKNIFFENQIETKKFVHKKKISAGEVNPVFLEAFHSFSKHNKMLLIYGNNDRLYWEFKEKYLKKYENKYKTISKNITVYEIEDANHELTLTEWQDRMERIISSWLTELGYHRLAKENQYVYVESSVN